MGAGQHSGRHSAHEPGSARSPTPNEPDDATSVFSDAIVLDPTLAEAWHQRAIARFKAGDAVGAVQDLHETLRLEPRHFAAWETLEANCRGARGLESRLRRVAARHGYRSSHAARRGPAEGSEAEGFWRQRVTATAWGVTAGARGRNRYRTGRKRNSLAVLSLMFGWMRNRRSRPSRVQAGLLHDTCGGGIRHIARGDAKYALPR